MGFLGLGYMIVVGCRRCHPQRRRQKSAYSPLIRGLVCSSIRTIALRNLDLVCLRKGGGRSMEVGKGLPITVL